MSVQLLEQICNRVDLLLFEEKDISIDIVLAEFEIDSSHQSFDEFKEFGGDYKKLRENYKFEIERIDLASKGASIKRVLLNAGIFGIGGAVLSSDTGPINLDFYRNAFNGFFPLLASITGGALTLYDEVKRKGLNMSYIGTGMYFGYATINLANSLISFDDTSLLKYVGAIAGGFGGNFIRNLRKSNADYGNKTGEKIDRLCDTYEDKKRELINFYSIFVNSPSNEVR
jgi:hypothetical protein